LEYPPFAEQVAEGTFSGLRTPVPHRQEQKKPTWQNTRRYSTTSAYSSTSPPAGPGCYSPSHPTTSATKPRPTAPRPSHRYHCTPPIREHNSTFPFLPNLVSLSPASLEDLMAYVP
jgi:hypothetical protein